MPAHSGSGLDVETLSQESEIEDRSGAANPAQFLMQGTCNGNKGVVQVTTHVRFIKGLRITGHFKSTDISKLLEAFVPA